MISHNIIISHIPTTPEEGPYGRCSGAAGVQVERVGGLRLHCSRVLREGLVRIVWFRVSRVMFTDTALNQV